MKIDVARQACCSQDDQRGPLERTFGLPDTCRLDEFLAAVMASGFLQFSSSHRDMGCRIDDREVARVSGPGLLFTRKPRCVLPPGTPMGALAAGRTVHFVFDRN